MPRAAAVLATLLATAMAAWWLVGRERASVARMVSNAPAAVAAGDVEIAAADGWQRIVAHGQPTSPAAPARSTPLASAALPEGPLAVVAPQLEQRAANGDALAARALADGYRRCEFHVSGGSHAELERRAEENTVFQLGLVDQMVDQVKQQVVAGGGKFVEPKIDPMPTYREQVAAEEGRARRCDGLDAAKARDWFSWYERAAMLGDLEAELGYWHEAFSRVSIADLDEVVRRKQLAAAFLDDALSHGDSRALAAIGMVLQIGYYAEPDAFSAHAYFFAAAQAPVADIGVLPWIGPGLARMFSGSDTAAEYRRRMDATSRSLDAGAVAQAERVGTALFARCCAGRHP